MHKLTLMETASIHQIRLPLPFALDHINCYAIKGKTGWSLIDTGLNYQPSQKAWEEAFILHEIALDNIEAIYLTHYHPDHFGCAGWLQKLSGAPVFISSTDGKRAQSTWLGYQGEDDIYSTFFRRCGLSPNEISEIIGLTLAIRPFVQPYPELKTIIGEELIALGDDKYVAIHTPGHSDGHLCFYCKENGVMFSGDHLLAHITSNISLWPETDPDPLSDYLSSLKKVKTFNPKIVLPSHGPSFTNAEERVSELEEHHRQRFKKILSLARSRATAYEICLRLFGEDLPFQEKRFALGETLAHLAYLQRRGKLKCSSKNGVIYYSN